MKRISTIAATGLLLALGLNAAPAQAQANRTFVSGHGSDSNPCSIAAPCRSFAFAITQTNPGGELAVLDTAGYGTVTITKAVSIINQAGVEAGITATSGDGITVAAGANDVVNLRGLTLVGGGGTNGITFTSGGTLNIQNCTIRGFTGSGLNLTPGASSQFNVADTIISNNGASGIYLQPTGAGTTTSAFFERVQAIGNFNGFWVSGAASTGTLRLTATNSDASGNTFGFVVGSPGGKAVTTFTVVNSTAVNNSNAGLASAFANATMFVAGSTVSGNATHGFNIGLPGGMKTFGNNNITDTNNLNGPMTPVLQQ